MKIIFFGLGSIGQRHAKIISDNFNHELFAYRSNKKCRPNTLGIKEVYTWDSVRKIAPQIAFITNPTYLHVKTAIRCADLGMNLFLEKPIDVEADKLDELVDTVKKKGLTAYVAYNLRFNPIINMIKKKAAAKKIMHCRITVSSSLPDWRPGRNYRDIYSACSKKGGGVILDLSHDIDYCTYLFGDILSMKGIFGKMSHLSVNCEDYADIIMKTKKAIINLHLNFFSKNLQRTVEIDFADSGYLKADLITKIGLIYRQNKKKVFKYNYSDDDIYLKQLRYFFKNINNRKIINNIRDAARLFRKILAFKESHETER